MHNPQSGKQKAYSGQFKVYSALNCNFGRLRTVVGWVKKKCGARKSISEMLLGSIPQKGYIFPTQDCRRDVPLTMTLAAWTENDAAASSAQTGGRTFTSHRVLGQLLEKFSIED